MRCAIHYLTSVSFKVVKRSDLQSNDGTNELVSYQLSIVFHRDPKDDEIHDLERLYGLKAATRVKNIVAFEAPRGVSDSIVENIRKTPNIDTITPTRTGQGQSAVNFVSAELEPALAKERDESSAVVDLELAKDGTAGLQVKLKFSDLGVYQIQGKVGYENSFLYLPLCRVTVRR
jgi:hypothetical protein